MSPFPEVGMCFDAGFVSDRGDANTGTDRNRFAVLERHHHRHARRDIGQPVLQARAKDSRVGMGYLNDVVVPRQLRREVEGGTRPSLSDGFPQCEARQEGLKDAGCLPKVIADGQTLAQGL
jgi:hypothetical protein